MTTTSTSASGLNAGTRAGRRQIPCASDAMSTLRSTVPPPAQGNVRLDTGAGLSLKNVAGVEITCLSGHVWLTMDGDSRDITLSAGDAFTVERDGLTLISALGPSLVNVRRKWDDSYARWPRWLQTVATWLARTGEARARRHRLSRFY